MVRRVRHRERGGGGEARREDGRRRPAGRRVRHRKRGGRYPTAQRNCIVWGEGGRKRKGNFGNSKGISNGGNGAGEAAVAKVKILAIPRSPGVGNEE